MYFAKRQGRNRVMRASDPEVVVAPMANEDEIILVGAADALAQALEAALVDSALRQRLATAAYRTYLELTRPALSRRFLQAMRLDAAEACP